MFLQELKSYEWLCPLCGFKAEKLNLTRASCPSFCTSLLTYSWCCNFGNSNLSMVRPCEGLVPSLFILKNCIPSLLVHYFFMGHVHGVRILLFFGIINRRVDETYFFFRNLFSLL